MDKQELLNLTESAYDTAKMEPKNLFLYKLFQFEFAIDEEERTCSITCPVTDIMLNPLGIIHGGVLTYLTDTVMGILNYHYKDAPYVTLELKNSFFKGVGSGKLIATGRYMKDGYKVSYLEADVKNEEGDLLCKTSGTFYRYEKK